MRQARGQSLVELALCLPILIAIALGGAALARVADARAGLDGATQAALAAAGRAKDQASAEAAAAAAFSAALAGYPVHGGSFVLTDPGFSRGSAWTGDGWGSVDISFAGLPGLPAQVRLHAQGTVTVEWWRGR